MKKYFVFLAATILIPMSVAAQWSNDPSITFLKGMTFLPDYFY